MFRRFKFLRDRILASIEISRLYRGHKGRLLFDRVKAAHINDLTSRIQRKFRQHQGRKIRWEIMTKEHMAAWKIQRCVKKHLYHNLTTRRRIMEAAAARKNRERLELRATLLEKKRQKIVDSLKLRYWDRFCCPHFLVATYIFPQFSFPFFLIPFLSQLLNSPFVLFLKCCI